MGSSRADRSSRGTRSRLSAESANNNCRARARYRARARQLEGELLERRWAREEISLRPLAAELAQRVRLLLSLDAFGHHFDAEPFSQQKYRLYNLRLPLVLAHRAD